MSEAELHILRARLQGGVLNAARRGELKMRLPVGYVYDEMQRVILDPDPQVQGALRLLCETFERTGSATATVKAFRQQGVKFPTRPHGGPGKGQLLWGELRLSQVLRILHNPRYAGAFVFGRSRTRPDVQGHSHTQRLPRAQWPILLPVVHAGYIDWEHFEANERRLRDNAQARGLERRTSPPREGNALLQGIVVCGKCGGRMTVRYISHGQQPIPHYMCQRAGIEQARPICQKIPGAGIDAAVGALLLEVVTPLNLEVALAVEEELRGRLAEADALRQAQVERARYEAELCRRRYLRVDPDNRLVADALEAQWNEALRALQAAQEDYERQHQADARQLDEAQKAEIHALADAFPQVWRDPTTPQRERKRLLRLVIEDVTLLKEEEVHVHIRLRSGRTRTLTLPRPGCSWELRQTDAAIIHKIDQLFGQYTAQEVADRLNAEGLQSGWGRPFHARMIQRLCRDHGLKSRYDRLRAAGMLTVREMAQQLDVSTDTVKRWRRQGRLTAHRFSDRKEYLLEPPGAQPPEKYQRQRTRRQQSQPLAPDQPVEV